MFGLKRKKRPATPHSQSLPDGLLDALDAAYRSGGKFVVIVAHYDPSRGNFGITPPGSAPMKGRTGTKNR